MPGCVERSVRERPARVDTRRESERFGFFRIDRINSKTERSINRSLREALSVRVLEHA